MTYYEDGLIRLYRGKQERIEASSAVSALKAAWNAYRIQQETESVKS